MERAVLDLLRGFGKDDAMLVVISGPDSPDLACETICLSKPPGWKGRIDAVPSLYRKFRDAPNQAPIVAVGVWSFAACAIACIFARRRVILWEHSILTWRLRNELRVLVAALMLRLFSPVLEHVVCVSAASRVAVKYFVWPFSAITIIPNVVDIDHSHGAGGTKKRAPGQIRLVGLGSLSQRKNWGLAIRALTYLPQAYRLQIAGEGIEREGLERLIRQHGLSDRVELLGHIPRASRLLADADIMVHPSHAETFGYSLFEACEFGVPVVALDKPVMNEVIPQVISGACARNSPADYANKILEVAAQSVPLDQGSIGVRLQPFSRNQIRDLWREQLEDSRRSPGSP
ncbi:glycosyltransferase family 4 protein [Gordonia jacobaea]|uniref:glycosyltransferase family 4 protein n=1 Tax=Gordonia jacobaea TaxID=122202 RepID=UPI0009FB6CFC